MSCLTFTLTIKIFLLFSGGAGWATWRLKFLRQIMSEKLIMVLPCIFSAYVEDVIQNSHYSSPGG